MKAYKQAKKQKQLKIDTPNKKKALKERTKG
jgi:hypothetical protein